MNKERAHKFPCRLTKRPIGQILVDAGFIRAEDLNVALSEQIRTNELLGEILLRLGLIAEAELKAALAIQRDISTCEGAFRAAFGIRHLLGEILLRAKKISAADLDDALKEQRQTGEKLGEILIKRGLISKEELNAALAFQERLGRPLPEIEKLHLGELLVEAGYISRKQLQEALEKSRSSNKELEAALLDAGVKPHHIEHGRKIQEKLLTAALIAALTLAPVAYAETKETQHAAKATVTVTATVLARASLKVLHQLPEIVVTEADVQRGYVEARGATKIEVRSNTAYMLIFESHGLPFKEVQISGLDSSGSQSVIVSSGGGAVMRPERGNYTVELNYRFMLDKSTHPGTYEWPLSIAISPM